MSSDPNTALAKAPSYHDLYITTPRIARTSIFNLPFRVRVECSRASGWSAYAVQEGALPEEDLGSEYGGKDGWLVLDVAGHVICDGRENVSDDE